jgi:hypothetical protein
MSWPFLAAIASEGDIDFPLAPIICCWQANSASAVCLTSS